MWEPVAYLGELDSRRAMYRYLARWLELLKGDDLRAMIDALGRTTSLAEFEAQEVSVLSVIAERHALDL